MSRYPDLVQGTKLDTSFTDDYTVHEHEDSEDEQCLGRPARRVEYWRTERPLAEGGFGEVYLQQCIEGRRRVYLRAVKVLSKFKSRAKNINYITELEVIAKFSQKRYSNYFVKLLGWYDTDNDLFIAMEYFPLGDLQQYISKNQSLPEPDAQQVSYQVLEGLNYMHSENFAHRDIKPGNILIKSCPPDGSWWIKLSDFGISKRLDPSVEQNSTVKGTWSYMPPELFGYESGTPRVINYQAADMWSAGEMVFRMLSNEAVFPSPQVLLRYAAQPDFFPSEPLERNGAGKQAVDFIRSLMRPAPGDRLTSSQALDHPWLRPLRPSAPVISAMASRSTAPTPPMGSGLTTSNGWGTASSTDMSISRASLSAPPRPTTRPLTTSAPAIESRSSDSLFPPSLRLAPPTNQPSDKAWDGESSINVWDHDSGACIQTLKGHSSSVYSVTFSPDGRQIISGSVDRTIKIWDRNSGACMQTLKGHGGLVLSVTFSPDGRQIISGSVDRTVKIWDRNSGTCMQTLEGHGGSVGSVTFSPDGRQIISGSDDDTIKIWDCNSGTCMQTLEGHGNSVCSVAFSPDGRQIISGSDDSTIKIWDRDSGACAQTLKGHSSPVRSVAFSPDGRQIISGSLDSTIKVWARD
ncbi:uncharacterized protein DNG_05206 [Cephalotrichum gorgonifer]|uniref:Mitochondrial division protein 1 n=1 Tax=Cephalotrichum gorgonifer TaxID=2041049 RepID=A0AAE8SVC0_9PEZI|nr:uncharacterized protein DNG_05206 [Cephalotrichum gorgonifer]